MRPSFLMRLRGEDGRSLMRALAVLVFLNACLAGFHSTMAVANDGLALHCVASGSGGGAPTMPAGDRDCCLAACAAMAAPALVAPAASILLPRAVFLDAATPAAEVPAPSPPLATHPAPRGPPLSA